MENIWHDAHWAHLCVSCSHCGRRYERISFLSVLSNNREMFVFWPQRIVECLCVLGMNGEIQIPRCQSLPRLCLGNSAKVKDMRKADARKWESKYGSVLRMGDWEGLWGFSDSRKGNGYLGESLKWQRPMPTVLWIHPRVQTLWWGGMWLLEGLNIRHHDLGSHNHELLFPNWSRGRNGSDKDHHVGGPRNWKQTFSLFSGYHVSPQHVPLTL